MIAQKWEYSIGRPFLELHLFRSRLKRLISIGLQRFACLLSEIILWQKSNSSQKSFVREKDITCTQESYTSMRDIAEILKDSNSQLSGIELGSFRPQLGVALPTDSAVP